MWEVCLLHSVLCIYLYIIIATTIEILYQILDHKLVCYNIANTNGYFENHISYYQVDTKDLTKIGYLQRVILINIHLYN